MRAIAVVSVLVSHAFPSLLPGGYVGVDIFFVISGYLISQVLLRDLHAGRFSIGRFYVRRIRRLFPALLLVLVFCFAAGYVLLPPQQFKETGRTAVSTALFLSNFDFIRLTSGYFAADSNLMPLLHTWSLAVEEQFYVVYPLLLYALWRFFRQRMAWILFGLFVIALVASEAMTRAMPSTAYMFSPARAFELLLGAVVATATIPAGRAETRTVLSFVGLACMAVPMFVYNERTPFPGLAAFVPCLGVALILFAGQERESLGGRMISSGPFQFFGNISYSLYLWHWPLLVFARSLFGFDFDPMVASVAAALSILLAALSYRYVEQPFLSHELAGLPYLRLGAAMVLLISAAGAGIFASGGLPGRFSAPAVALFAAASDSNPRPRCHGSAANPVAYEKACLFGDQAAAPDLAIWGDSHGMEAVVALGERAKEANRSLLQLTTLACPPTLSPVRDLPHCQAVNRRTLAALVDDRRIKTVILMSHLRNYRDLAGFEKGFDEVVQRLTEAGKRVVLLMPIPVMPVDPPYQIGRAVEWGRDPSALGVRRTAYDDVAAAERRFLTELGVRYRTDLFDPVTVLCDARLCHVYDRQAGVLYYERNHLSVQGARFALSGLADSLYGKD